MKFREPNEVNWQGVRPGHNGTQVVEYDHVVNGTDLVYTVTAGKILYLISWTHNIVNNSGGVGTSTAYIDDGINVWYMFDYYHGADNVPGGKAGNQYPPIEVPAGYRFQHYSNAVNVDSYLSFFGWEE